MGLFDRIRGRKEEQERQAPAQEKKTDKEKEPAISEEQKEAEQKKKLEMQIRSIKSRWDQALVKAQRSGPDRTPGQVIADSFIEEGMENIVNSCRNSKEFDPQQLYVAVKTAGRCLEMYDRQFPPEKGEADLSDLYRTKLRYADIDNNSAAGRIISSYLHEDPSRDDGKDLMAMNIYRYHITEVIKRDAQLDIREVPKEAGKEGAYYIVETKGGTKISEVKTQKQAEVLKKDIEAALGQGEELYTKPSFVDLEHDLNTWRPEYAYGEDYLKNNFAVIRNDDNYFNIDREAEISVKPVQAWYVEGSALVRNHISFTGKDEGYGSKIKDPKGFLYGYKIEADGRSPYYEKEVKEPVYIVPIDSHQGKEQAEKVAYAIRAEIEEAVRKGEQLDITPGYIKDVQKEVNKEDGILTTDDLSARTGIDPFREMEDLCDIPVDQRIKNSRKKAEKDNERNEDRDTAERKGETR